MYRLIAYLKHIISGTNQHGVHSPFVYNFVTQCLYNKPKFKRSISENVVLKSISYFHIKSFKISIRDSKLEQKIHKEFGLKEGQNGPFDLIYLDDPRTDALSIHKDEIHNDSVILIRNIHRNKNASTVWETFKHHEIVTVSIDLFHCGVLFFRKEQVKEHFKIRI